MIALFVVTIAGKCHMLNNIIYLKYTNRGINNHNDCMIIKAWLVLQDIAVILRFNGLNEIEH